MNLPLIAEVDRTVSRRYDTRDPNASEVATVRSVFVIAPDKTVQLILTYPMSTGRNFDEILRAIHSLQLTAVRPVPTPADWRRCSPPLNHSPINPSEAANAR